MAETFIREPNTNGDNNAWAPYLLQQTRNTLGALSAYLYNDSGTLKLAPGVIGIDDGTNKGTITNSAAKTISLALVSVSSWIKIELSVSGTSVTISASDATAGADPAALPTEFKNAYNATKGGFYITATKRCIGLAWRNAAGTLEGVVNCLPFIDGWIGYSQSNDANDYPYFFEKNIKLKSEKFLNAGVNAEEVKNVLYKTSAGVFSLKKIRTAILEIGPWNMDTTANVTITHGLGDITKIRTVEVKILPDDSSAMVDLMIGPSLGAGIQGWCLVSTNITLSRAAAGGFDGPAFDDAVMNRGFIIIDYEV